MLPLWGSDCHPQDDTCHPIHVLSMPWQMLLSVSILGEVTSRLLQKSLLNKKSVDPVAFSILFQMTTGIFLGILAFFGDYTIPNLIPILPNLLLAPLLYAAANVCMFLSLKRTDASLFTIFFATRAIWLVLAAIIFLNESFLPKQFLGTIILLAGVFLVSWKKQAIRVQKGEILAMIGAFFFGIAVINDSFILRELPVIPYLSYGFLAPGLVIWLVFAKKTRDVVALVKERTLNMHLIGIAVVYGITAIAYFTAYKAGNNAAQIGAIAQVTTVLTVLAAIVFLKEKANIPQKILAAILSFIGVVLLQ